MSTKEEQEYLDKMQKEGVDIPEFEEKDEAEEAESTEDESTESEGQSEDKPEEGEEESSEHLQEKKEKKRTIYDDYKEKKNELKLTKETLAQIQAERDELLQKVKEANTPQEIQEAKDEIEEFARSINADPEAIRKMQALFLKGVKPSIDDSLKKDLEEFKQFKAQNQDAIMKQKFDDSFNKAKPVLKDLFPNASSEEMESIKQELSTLNNEEEWKGKDLDFIAFKNKTVLSALVSPRKRGMESKGRQQGADNADFEFNPNADLSKMSPKEQERWEAAYKKMSRESDGGDVMRDADGRMSIV